MTFRLTETFVPADLLKGYRFGEHPIKLQNCFCNALIKDALVGLTSLKAIYRVIRSQTTYCLARNCFAAKPANHNSRNRHGTQERYCKEYRCRNRSRRNESVPIALLILTQISIACKELLRSLKQAILIKARIINSDLLTPRLPPRELRSH